MLNVNNYFSKTKQGILVIQKNGKILELNSNLIQILGYDESEILGVNLFHFIYQENEKLSAIDEVILRGTFLDEQSMFIPLKTKTDIILRINFLFFHSDEKILCIADLTSSYSEIKELIQTSFQEIIAQLKRNFIENYDINIRENLQELVLNSMQAELEKDPSRLLKLYSEQKNIFNKIFRILDIFRKLSQADELENFQIQKIDILKALNEDLLFFEAVAKSKNLKLEIDFPKENLFVLGNDVLLTQIFSFIIDNSIKYTEKGKILVQSRQENGAIIINFIDTGIGINSNTLSSLFDENLIFNKKSITNTEPRSLYIAKKYLDILQGKIYVESEPGMGSSFSVLIPLI